MNDWKSSKNKFLVVQSQVVLTPAIDNVIALLDPVFEKENLQAHVTSGLRTADKQLSLIKEKAIALGVDKEFPEIHDAAVTNQASWIKAWSRLLTKGFMINPPVSAECAFDYKKPTGEVRKAGHLIGISNHQRGHSFDIGGEIEKIEALIKSVIANEKEIPIAGFLFEPVNHAVHVDAREE